MISLSHVKIQTHRTRTSAKVNSFRRQKTQDTFVMYLAEQRIWFITAQLYPPQTIQSRFTGSIIFSFTAAVYHTSTHSHTSKQFTMSKSFRCVDWPHPKDFCSIFFFLQYNSRTYSPFMVLKRQKMVLYHIIITEELKGFLLTPTRDRCRPIKDF